MTQIGKCDTCRQRKVKCDEDRPKCGACRKKDRPCTYSYGKASAFVVQDPNQMTKHGKSRTEPVVFYLDSNDSRNAASPSMSANLRITTEREAENGQGFFQTLAPIAKPKPRLSKKKINQQKRALGLYLQSLQEESAVVYHLPSSPETSLITRYIGMLGSETLSKQPISILGTWIQSIPSRIGSNRMLDLAVEFFVSSHAAYRDNVFSKRKVAKISKAKALKELQLVVLNTDVGPTYDVLLATKMHFAAEALLGIDSMYHAIHAFGLAELLKTGAVSDVDDEHFWNFIDNTYVDDVNEAMLAGRKSVYDNDFYLSATYPPPLDSTEVMLSATQRASMAIMHVFVQCPYAVCLIRNAILNPENSSALAAAVSHIECLILIDVSKHVSELMQTAISVVPNPACPEMSDIMPNTLEFDSVQSMILCTRYWMLQNVLCGFVDSLYRHFPSEAASSLLPSLERIRVIDVDSALHLAKSVRWAESISQKLPLVPLRLHTPLQVSIGPWHRMIRYLSALRSADTHLGTETEAELSRAERMKAWIINECNAIHIQWDVSVVDEPPLLEALDSMAGEKIPDWLPVRVRFEAEDGEMVMKLDYENRTGTYLEKYDLGEAPRPRMPHPGTSGQNWQRELGVLELPLRPLANDTDIETSGTQLRNERQSPKYTRPADFIHGTGRNLCATSGWWPSTPNTSTVLLDSTHKASAFSRRPCEPSAQSPQPSSQLNDMDSHPCLASSWWPQIPNTSSASRISSTPTARNFSTTPTSSGASTITFNIERKNACFSPAWVNDS